MILQLEKRRRVGLGEVDDGKQRGKIKLGFWGKKIKGENMRDKRRIFGRERGLFDFFSSCRAEGGELERKEKKGEEERAKFKPKTTSF